MKNTLLTLALFTFSALAAQAAAPVNDIAAKAIKLTSNYQVLPAVDLSTATAASTDPLVNGVSAGKTVWYKLPRTMNDGLVTWSLTITSTTGVGYAVPFYQHDPDNPLTGLVSYGTTYNIAAGQTGQFLVGVSGQPMMLMIAGTGSVQITHRLVPATAFNDFPSTADVISGDRSTISSDNTSASLSADEPDLGVPGTNTLWYSWTPAFSDTAAVDTNFSFVNGPPQFDQGVSGNVHDTVLAVYLKSPQGALTLVGNDDNSGWQTNSRVVFTATAGQTYLIAVGSGLGSAPGEFVVNCYRANTAGEVYLYNGKEGSDLGASSVDRGTHTIAVVRRYVGNLPLTCTLATDNANSTATVGVDYQNLSTSVVFANPSNAQADSAWRVDKLVTLLGATAVVTSPEEVAVKISNIPIAGTLGNPSVGVFHLFASQPQNPNKTDAVRVETPEVRVSESVGSLSVNIVRDGPSGGFVDLNCSMVNGSTATLGEDFYYTGHFPLYQATTSQALYHTIQDDNVFEPEESVTFKVSGHAGSVFYTISIEDDDPFIPTTGLLTATLSYASKARTGQLYAAVNTSGGVTGKFIAMGRSIPFSTKLDWRGKAVALLPIPGRASLSLTIQATDATGGFSFTLVDGGSQGADIATAVLQNYSAKLNPCPEAGRYTWGDLINSLASVNTALVSKSGTASVAGRMMDGTAYTMTGYIDGEGTLTAATSLYGGLGCIGFRGPLPLADGQATSLSCKAFRPTRAGDASKLEVKSWDNITINGYRYTPPAIDQRALDCWSGGNGKATLSDGPLMSTLTKALTVSTKNIVTAPLDAEKLKITLVPSTGMFSGSFVLPGSSPAKTLTFCGVLTDIPGINSLGEGYFFDGLKIGTITIGKP
jgi:hypothetical protein